ncbi:S8 family serine peptidase [Thermococcus sp.]|uniref:S8 family serine peptidase n=1 Tax=Thermococcus sp. TaxID=35749 RepID=UPI00262BEE4E|nr:S8 family serine peptidase [Thermococcus sp.]
MNRKALGVLIALLMVASLVPLTVPALATSGSVPQSTTAAYAPSPKILKGGTSQSAVAPQEKINPVLLKAVKGEQPDLIKTIKGEQYVPAYFVATGEVQVPRGVKVFGYANIDGFYVYNIMVPVGERSDALLIKLASIPDVKTIDVVKPELVGSGSVETISAMELMQSFEKLAKQYPELQVKLNQISAHRKFISSLYGKKDKLPWELIDRKSLLNTKVPVLKSEASKTPRLEPDDMYVVKHNGAMNAWKKYDINGSGVKIAILDTGVDFGNPALMDAYAVDTNKDSPYYGWPIMYDPGSLFQYLAFGTAFPDALFNYGFMNEYANTSYLTGFYTILSAPYIVGYYNSTYNYSVVFSGMSLASIPNKSDRVKVLADILNWVASKSGGISRVLVVDDDGGQNNGGNYLDFEKYYYEALDALGIPYDRITIPAGEGLPNDTFSNYDLVIMFTGEDNESFIGNDTEVIASYLKKGGNLVLFSADYLYQTLSELEENQTALANFTVQYLHINATDSMPDIGIPTVLDLGTFNVSVRRFNRGIGMVYDYTGYGFNLPFLIPSLIDLADVPSPMNGTEVIGDGYMAIPVIAIPIGNSTYYLPIFGVRLPMDNNLNVPLKSGEVHLGFHPDLFLAFMNNFYLAPNVLTADPNEPGKYDEVYVSLTTDFGMFVDFNDDVGHGKDNPVVAWDLNGDGLPDISGGLVYYIADGQKPIPYSDIYYQRWHLADMGIPFKVPEAGSLVAFMIDYFGIPHGTGCASSAAARGDRVYYDGIKFSGIMYVPAQPGEEYPIYGTAPGAKIMAVPLLTTWTSSVDWMSAMFFATSGYDGIPDTGDEAQVVSNSYGNSYTITKGFNYDDRFLYYLTHYFAPHVAILYAAGNGGPGYGTVTDEGASPGVITVGAATDSGYRVPLGWDSGEVAFGDVIGWSDGGPNGLGQAKDDVLATGAYGAEADYVNYHLNGMYAQWLFSGTSMATPVAAGITALVYEAYYKAHGTWPTSDLVRDILKSSAENINTDVFRQGAGYLNATRAVELALGKNGILIQPTSWQPGKTDYPAFPNVMYPGESASKTFTLTNYGFIKKVTVEPMVFEKIGEQDFNVNVSNESSVWIDLTPYIPSDAELMKVTMYSTYFANPFVRVYFYDPTTGEMTRVNDDGKEGNIVSFTVHDPLKRANGRLVLLRVYPDENYPATIKVEFFKREPWKWVTVNGKQSFTTNFTGKLTFTATITLPKDTPYGIYEGAIYVKYGNHESTIPVSVVVASPSADFAFGGENRTSNGLYDNSYVYGVYDWGWRYETGDWRFFYFNSEHENGVIVTDLMWDQPGDINVHLLGPLVDSWSVSNASVFGPYTLEEIAQGCEGYAGGGFFEPCTETGSYFEEIVKAPASKGLHSIVLHNIFLYPLFGYPMKFAGHVGVAYTKPMEWKVFANTSTGTGEIAVHVPDFLGPIRTDKPFGYISETTPYLNIVAPPTGNSTYFNFTVPNDTMSIDITTESVFPPNILDVDFFLYYNNSGTLELVASATTWGTNEHIHVDNPMPGQYILEAYSWDNEAPGEATFSMYITEVVPTDRIGVYNVTYTGDGDYVIETYYNITNTTIPFKGFLVLGTIKRWPLMTVPVTILPAQAKTDIAVTTFTYTGDVELGGDLNITYAIKNLGEVDAPITVEFYRDGAEIPFLTYNIVLPANSTLVDSIPLPITDTELHEYMIKVTSPLDYNDSNNAGVFAVRPVTEQTIEEAKETGAEVVNALNGEVKILNITRNETNEGGVVNITFEGDHGTVATLYVSIPSRIHNYTVTATGADVLDYKVVEDDGTTKVLEVTVQLHSVGTIEVKYTYPVSVLRTTTMTLMMLNYMYYHNFVRYNETFSKLYQKALTAGIDNETLQKAEELYKMAIAEYREATTASGGAVVLNLGDPRVFIHLRKAYAYLKEAIDLLEGAGVS